MCDSESIARFLYERGAVPTAERITSFINGGTCGEDGNFLIEHVDPEELAEMSMTINFNDNQNEWDKSYAGFDEEIISEKRKGVNALIRKNRQYCQQNLSANCEAQRHLETELADLKERRLRSLIGQACGTYNELDAYKERMDLQLEFGKKTGVASPKTYDALIRQSQLANGRLNYLNGFYRTDTGKDLSRSLCQ